MTKSFKESLRKHLENIYQYGFDVGIEERLPADGNNLENWAEAILALIAEYAPPEIDSYTGTDMEDWQKGHSAGIKAYKQSLGVDNG